MQLQISLSHLTRSLGDSLSSFEDDADEVADEDVMKD